MKTKTALMMLGVAAGVAAGAPAHAAVKVVTADAQPYCREFQQSVTIGGVTQQGYGTACLQPDGSWEIQPNTTAATPATVVVSQPSIQYVVEKQRVYMVPPRPFVVGTVLVGGRVHHFDDDFRPRWQPGMHEGHGGHPVHHR
jgi:hypothetical protein